MDTEICNLRQGKNRIYIIVYIGVECRQESATTANAATSEDRLA